MHIRELFRNLRFVVREKVAYSRLDFLFKLKKKPQAVIVKRSSKVLIEGYPRSGNTFFVAYFRYFNAHEDIASHYHAIFQLRKAVKFNVPIVVLVRPPLESIVSLLIRENLLYPRLVIESYINFYKSLQSFKDDIVVADFKEAISEPDLIIRKVNERFMTSFAAEKLTPELRIMVNQIVDQMDKISRDDSEVDELKVSRPSVEKERLKSSIAGMLTNEYKKEFKLADKLYLAIKS